jgi:large subunit ribosomal protein L29
MILLFLFNLEIMKQEEIVKMSTEDLTSKMLSTGEQLAAMKFNHKMTPMENPLRIRGMRRLVARMKTELARR